MGKSVPFEGKRVPQPDPAGGLALDRIASFRVTYIAIFAFLLLYVFTVQGLEQLLDRHFKTEIGSATLIDPLGGPVTDQIQARIDGIIRGSRWVSVGGVIVTAIVIGADGHTPLYVGGRRIPPPMSGDPLAVTEEAARLLPATADVLVSVPHNSLAANGILVVYAGLLIQTLFLYDRRRSRLERERLATAVASREEAAMRAAHIEQELAQINDQVDERVEAEVSEEMNALRDERARLQEKLDAISNREHQLRARSGELEQTLHDERQALEDLLEDSLADLGRKDEEIRELESQLKRASKSRPASGSKRSRELEGIERRLRTLYKNVEIDDHAIQGLAALGDESTRLRAEEAVKRLADDVESAAVRRKVGGLPSHLHIFELGFAGKGRIYYTTGGNRRYRVLVVGAKNSQKTDLEYLSRLPKE